MDLLKHGESAYPADAWVEAQYMKDGGIEVNFKSMFHFQFLLQKQFQINQFQILNNGSSFLA